jgi:hypothetical protein
MASGHVNRIQRPNTWLHRPMLQNVKKALANSEPSTHGTFRTYQRNQTVSAFTGKADVERFHLECRRWVVRIGSSRHARAIWRAADWPFLGPWQ